MCVGCHVRIQAAMSISANGDLHALECPILPLQGRRSPSEDMCSPIFLWLRGLVSMSATMIWVGQYVMLMTPSVTALWIKWKHMLMCFILAWKVVLYSPVMI